MSNSKKQERARRRNREMPDLLCAFGSLRDYVDGDHLEKLSIADTGEIVVPASRCPSSTVHTHGGSSFFFFVSLDDGTNCPKKGKKKKLCRYLYCLR